MQAIFNELSVTEFSKIGVPEDLLLQLIGVCASLQKLDSTFKMRTNTHFLEINLVDNLTVRDFILKNIQDANIMFLLAIIDSPYLPDDEISIDVQKFFEEDLYFNEQLLDTDCGIRTAYAFLPMHTPMISLATDTWQAFNFLPIIKYNAPTVNVINIATNKQIYELHFKSIVSSYLTTKSANPTSVKVGDILPNKDITNAYLGYFEFYINEERRTVLNRDIPINKIKEIGSVVAKINGWNYHHQLSVLNNQRRVFEHHKAKTIFISIDTEKGDFEIHSAQKTDNHLGAISMDGSKIEPPKKHTLKFN
jgi:hypothetical protein